MPLDKQTAAFLKKLAESEAPPRYELPPVESRAMLRQAILPLAGAPDDLPRVEDRAAPGPEGEIPVRFYWPPESAEDSNLPILVYLHGGGWTAGDLDTHDVMCRGFCRGGGVIVASVDYRLAPEHRFPAGLEDCEAALAWIAANAADFGGDASRLALGGDSAGGNFTAVLCQGTRRSGPPIAYQVLIQPGVDWANVDDYASWAELGGGDYFFGREGMDWVKGQYLNDPKELSDTRVSPLLAEDLSGLPSTLIVTAGYDPLIDEGKRYAEALAAAGAEVEYKCFESTIHAFMCFAGILDAGREGIEFVGGRLRAQL